MENKVWKKEEIVQLLRTNDKAVLRGLLVVYSFQTKDEQGLSATVIHNGVGFNSFDADFMTSVAKQYKELGRLTTTQMRLVRKVIVKYAKQLTDVANGKLKALC